MSRYVIEDPDGVELGAFDTLREVFEDLAAYGRGQDENLSDRTVFKIIDYKAKLTIAKVDTNGLGAN